MKKDNVLKKIVASSLMAVIFAYFFTGLFKTLTLQNSLTDNMKDPMGILDFVVNGNLQVQVFIPLLSMVMFGVMYSKLGGKKGYKNASDHGVHGTSRWAEVFELIKGKAISSKNKFSTKDPFKTLKVEDGIVLGKVPNKNELVIMPKSTTVDNSNVFLIGASGSGKGQSFVFNNIINNTEKTMIITDPKGELHHATHQLKKDQGFEVFQIDFLNLDQARYNPLDYVVKDIDAKKIAETIAKNSAKDGKEDYFFTTARDLLTGLIIYTKSIKPSANMADVKKQFYKVSEDERYLSNVCEDIGFDHPAYSYLKDSSVAEGKTRTSILSSFAQQTGIFSLQDVAKMTTHSDFNFHDFQKRKSILYVKIPMKSNPVEALTATFFDQLISVFYDIADKHHGILPIKTMFLLDEFANLGKINDYEGTLSTCRGLGMEMVTVVQDLAQLENKYGKEIARTIINNHDTKLFLRTGDVETAKYFSSLAGEQTAVMQTSSSSQSGGIFTANSSASRSTQEQYVKRPLITDGELMAIDKNTCYLFVSGYYPLKLEKAWQYVIYGDFLFGKDRKPNYSSYREQYLKMLGVSEVVSSNDEEEVESNGGLEREVAISIEPEIETPEQFNQVVDIKLEPITDPFEKLAQQYAIGEFSVLETIAEGEPLNEELTEESDNEVLNQLEELSEIVNLVDIDEKNFIEAEKSLQHVEENYELLQGLDELDGILGSYLNNPENLSNELDEDFSLVD